MFWNEEKEERGVMLDENFKKRMKMLLGEEYPEFISAIEDGREVRGFRVNKLKASIDEFEAKFPYPSERLSYVDNGYILRSDEPVGRSAYHHAGMIYMQDPGAMASVSAIEIEPDWLVADLCSAPGGKSSQVAERLGEGGFLLSNEYVPKRAKITVSNLERLGVRNAIVTSLDTSVLAGLYRAVFDLVIVDAPCSGEGMFRKSEEAIREWSVDASMHCAKRQSEILENAHGMVKGGGYLLYSTCTYSKEENEDVVSAFLDRHSDYRAVEVSEPLKNVTRDGIDTGDGLSLTRRFYPHVREGEGQYIALLKRVGSSDMPTFLYKDAAKQLTKSEKDIVEGFFREALTEAPRGRLCRVGENIVIMKEGVPVPPKSVFMSGVLVGEIKGKLLFPSHQFFSAYGKLFKSKENLKLGDPRLEEYLEGQEIEAKEATSGYTAVLFEGATLGGGKTSGGRIKNHYPKGLRNK